MKVICF